MKRGRVPRNLIMAKLTLATIRCAAEARRRGNLVEFAAVVLPAKQS